MPDGPGNVGIKNIAKALNVSIGTVDRALHGRAGVSEKTKARVLAMAEELGYKPNLAAQALKLNRRLSIAVALPTHISHFFAPLHAGIRAAAQARVGMHVDLRFFPYPRMGVGDVDALEAALAQSPDGLIFMPGDTRRVEPLVRRCARAGTAVMCVGSDAPRSDRMSSVCVHAYVSGALAAELLAHKLPHKGNVAIFSGELVNLEHAEKLRGFAATLAVQAPHLRLLPALESHDQPEQAYGQAKALLRRADRPAGLYLSTANSVPVLQALEELGLLGEVQVVTTDLFHELVPLLECGKILATMYQRPFTQGKFAFDNLLALLLKEKTEHVAMRLPPHVVFRSNLPLFAHQIVDADEEEQTL